MEITMTTVLATMGLIIIVIVTDSFGNNGHTEG